MAASAHVTDVAGVKDLPFNDENPGEQFHETLHAITVTGADGQVDDAPVTGSIRCVPSIIIIL